MFTGIIQDVGELTASESIGGDRRLQVRTEAIDLDGVALGDSIAVAGACLTAVAIEGDTFSADVSNETLERTTLGRLGVRSPVNLELALTPTSRLGGHLVTGHVDGLARLIGLREDARSWRFDFEAPPDLARFIAAKGSVALEGVSLTVNEVEGLRFGVNLIPHTMEQTTLGRLQPGDAVNIEVDLLARYVARLQDVGEGADGNSVDRALLEEHGFA